LRPFRPALCGVILDEESHGFSVDGTAQGLRYGRLGSLRDKGLPWFCRFYHEISGLALMPFGNSNWPEIDGKMQPRWGRSLLGRLPRVAPPSRPWAERWNPFGIQARNFRKALRLGRARPGRPVWRWWRGLRRNALSRGPGCVPRRVRIWRGVRPGWWRAR